MFLATPPSTRVLIEDRIDRDDVGVPEKVVGAPLGPKSRAGLLTLLGGAARSVAWVIALRDPATAGPAPTAIAVRPCAAISWCCYADFAPPGASWLTSPRMNVAG